MTNDQPSAHLRSVHAAAQRAAVERRVAFARAQRDRVIASLLYCPEHAEPS